MPTNKKKKKKSKDARPPRSRARGRTEGGNPRPAYTVALVYEENAAAGFIYTVGLATHGFPEMLATNVPQQHSKEVGSLMNFLSDRMVDGHSVKGGQRVEHGELKAGTADITDPTERKRILNLLMCKANLSSRIIFITPRYPDAENYCSFPPAPENKKSLRDAIFYKLREEKFIRHIDGNTLNNSMLNLTYVSHYDAFSNPSWKVDWVIHLDDEEFEYTSNHMDHFATLYAPFDPEGADGRVWDGYGVAWGVVDDVSRCATCALCLRGCEVMQCGGCNAVTYCSVDCQRNGWKEHKLHCRPSARSTKQSSFKIYCSNCNTSMTKSARMTCSRCLSAGYCSEQCQSEHWKEHKKSCKAK